MATKMNYNAARRGKIKRNKISRQYVHIPFKVQSRQEPLHEKQDRHQLHCHQFDHVKL